MSRKKKQKRTAQAASREPARQRHPRNACLDSLRGLAIVLMVIDHAADILFHVAIDPSTIRLWTRLSMPLFCGLMGYFLVAVERIHWTRFYQLLLATLAINFVFFSVYGRLEILASLSVCYLLFILLRSWLCFGLIAAYCYTWDPTLGLFDFPVSIVLSCVAQGMLLRLYDWRIASLSGGLLTASLFFVDPPTLYVLPFVLPATWLIATAARHPHVQLRPLTLVGRYPLTAYLTQYALLLAIGKPLT